ncbi:MAG: glycosyltransferase family 2 protein [Chloroflexi bacterium]|nr:glycosyltransferase family 2 protein [Chloroflexota bacterium]MCY3582420.1 glycosyltransferase family 2 protein [Chloroflexota bacterium]MCY3717130.1 glycosyltransferase family 2 protein [Chloroflexota bacterium]MDE2651039.1 glycosyltransferase family 2 protein [Chloroflexota bacterium]MXX50646.1 glycosyltransferase family 2 protein [Chloroflexota bacterium]
MSSLWQEAGQPELALSVVIPIFNEAGNIERLYKELTAALRELGREYEVIAINDGSSDKSAKLLNALQARDQRWHIIHFRRNFGQTAAMAAGFDAARGEIVVTMDADLQNDPQDIARILDKFTEGYDIVSGWRQNRKEPFLLRRLPSAIANRIISHSTGIRLHDYGCTLKAYHFDVVKGVQLYGELHRFIPALASQMGVRVAEVPVADRARRWGSSKYGFGRTFKVILDLIVVVFLLGYFNRPLYVFGAAGFLVGGIGAVLGAYLTVFKLLTENKIGDRPLLQLAALLMVLGVQFVSTGIVADMIMRTYHESQHKPIYYVRERRWSQRDSSDTRPEATEAMMTG